MQCKKCGGELPFDAYGNIQCQFCSTANYVPLPGGKDENKVQKVIAMSGEGSCPKCDYPTNKINKRTNIKISSKKYWTDPEITIAGFLCPKCGYKYLVSYSDIKVTRRGVCPTCYGAFKKNHTFFGRTLYLKCDDCGAELKPIDIESHTTLRNRAQKILEDNLIKNPSLVKSALKNQGYDISFL